jgi:DNA-3-methyladenine glycosylase
MNAKPSKSGRKISPDFYLRPDVAQLSRELLGKVLVTVEEGLRTAGRIVEVEAYAGAEDKASHAYGNRRTARTEVMFTCGGVAYVYLCYGIHHLFNVVTHVEGIPHAILVRAVEPLEGIETMLRRRSMTALKPSLTAGPGSLSQAMGITTQLSGVSLLGDRIWIEDDGFVVAESEILASPRVGVGYAKEHALLPYRFRIKGNPWTSPAAPKYPS